MRARCALALRVVVASAAAAALVSAGIANGRPSGERISARPVALHPASSPGPVHDSIPVPAPAPAQPAEGQSRPVSASPPPALLVAIPHDMRVTARPGGGTVIGTMPAASRFYHVPIVAWVMERSPDGRYGRVTIPYSGTDRAGWIPLRGLRRSTSPITIEVDLSRHQLTLRRLGTVILRVRAATGRASSPTPPGRYFVTDRVPFAASSYFGSFAFGISGIQTHLPAGWTGGDQLAIHGTNDPGSIGTSASAGCVRLGEAALRRLIPLLRLGTPVVIRP